MIEIGTLKILNILDIPESSQSKTPKWVTTNHSPNTMLENNFQKRVTKSQSHVNYDLMC